MWRVSEDSFSPQSPLTSLSQDSKSVTCVLFIGTHVSNLCTNEQSKLEDLEPLVRDHACFPSFCRHSVLWRESQDSGSRFAAIVTRTWSSWFVVEVKVTRHVLLKVAVKCPGVVIIIISAIADVTVYSAVYRVSNHSAGRLGEISGAGAHGLCALRRERGHG